MANQRKPVAIKLLEGTYRKDRAVEEAAWPMVDGYPEAPDWLTGPDAVSQWNKAVRWLSDARVLTDPDLDRLANFCNMHADIVSSWRSGRAPAPQDQVQYRINAGLFGFTPADRHKVAPVGAPKRKNKFAELGRRSSE